MANNIQFRVDAVLGDYSQLQQQLNKLKLTANVNVNAGGLKNTNNQMQNMNNHQNAIIDSSYILKRVGYEAFEAVSNGVSDCIDYVKDLNAAMTNIRIVTMDTQQATESLLDTYNKMGQTLGANTLDIAEGAVDWLRQGYDAQEAQTLVQDSVILSKLALLDTAEATEYLTSALKGYRLEADDALGVIDQLVSIDLEAATSAGDMAEAMSRTANMAKTTGFEMNEILGVIATISEVTQNNAGVVGNSVKTMLSRMSNVAAGKEIDEEGEKINDVEKTLSSLGIALRTSENEWRDYYEVLDEIASKWDKLNGIQKSQITTALGGTRQRENVLVVLENWDKVKQYAETGANSMGTAMEKYGIYTESVAAKQEQLNAKVQEFQNNILDSDLIAGLLDIGKVFMDIVNWGDSLVGKLLLITTVSLALIVAWNHLGKIGITTFSALIAKVLGLAVAEGSAATAATVLKGVLDSMKSHPIILALSVICTLLVAGAAAFDALTTSTEEWREKLSETKQELNDFKSEATTLNEELKTTKDRIDELEGKGNLTLIEEGELERLKKENAELQRKIDLNKVAQKEAQKETNKTFVNTMQSDVGISGEFDTKNIYDDHYAYGSEQQYIYEQFEELKKATGEKAEDIKKYLTDKYTELSNVSEGIEYIKNPTTEDEKAVNAWLDYINEFNDKYMAAIGDTATITNLWTDIFTRDKFDEARIALQQLGEDGIAATADEIANLYATNDKVKEFIDYLISLGLIKFDSDFITKYDTDLNGVISTEEAGKASTEDLTNAFGGLANQLVDVEKSAKGATKAIEKMSYADIFDSIKDKADSLAEAEQEIAENGYLTAKSVSDLNKNFDKELEALGGLDQYLTLTANGYKISKEGLDVLNAAVVSQYQTSLNEAKQGALNVLDQEHKKGLSYASTTEEIKKQLQAQLALAKANTNAYKASWVEENGEGAKGEVVRTKAYQSLRAEEKAIEDAIEWIENAQKNYDVAKQTLETYKTTSNSGSSSSSKAQWEKDFDNLKEQLENNEISMDKYIKKLKSLRDKYKKETEAWKTLNKEWQDASFDNIQNQYDRGEINFNAYISRLRVLRRTYDEASEGYKELTQTMNEGYADNYADQYERGTISAEFYLKQLEKIRDSYELNSKLWNEYNDLINDTLLNETEKWIEELQEGTDEIDNAIDQLGNVNTVKEQVRYAELLSDKYLLIQKQISKIEDKLKDVNLTEEERIALQEKYNDLLKEEVDIRDEIEDSVRDYFENQKEQLEQEAELNKKKTLYNKEVELYGEQGKELYEYYTNKEIEALEAKKEALDANNEREELENNLLEARLKLQNALNNKTTKILKKQDDGSWQYEYSANMVDIKEAQDEIAEAEKAIEEYELQEQIDKLRDSMDNLASQYEDAEFWAERQYEQTINGIEEAFGDIDGLVEEWMETYGENSKELTNAYEKLSKSNADLKIEIEKLNSQIASKFETVGSKSANVESFDTGGNIVGNGLIFAHNKERVLTAKQNAYFEQLISKLPELLKFVDVSKFGGYAQQIQNLKNSNSNSNPTVISKVECIFPNITTTEGLQKAILELPRIALQKKK